MSDSTLLVSVICPALLAAVAAALIAPDGPPARPKSLEQVGVPVAITRAAAPADNPQTPEKIALGEKLFFDGRLSVDGTVASSTCHDPARAFTDSRPVRFFVMRQGMSRSPIWRQGLTASRLRP